MLVDGFFGGLYYAMYPEFCHEFVVIDHVSLILDYLHSWHDSWTLVPWLWALPKEAVEIWQIHIYMQSCRNYENFAAFWGNIQWIMIYQLISNSCGFIPVNNSDENNKVVNEIDRISPAHIIMHVIQCNLFANPYKQCSKPSVIPWNAGWFRTGFTVQWILIMLNILGSRTPYNHQPTSIYHTAYQMIVKSSRP